MQCYNSFYVFTRLSVFCNSLYWLVHSSIVCKEKKYTWQAYTQSNSPINMAKEEKTFLWFIRKYLARFFFNTDSTITKDINALLTYTFIVVVLISFCVLTMWCSTHIMVLHSKILTIQPKHICRGKSQMKWDRIEVELRIPMEAKFHSQLEDESTNS